MCRSSVTTKKVFVRGGWTVFILYLQYEVQLLTSTNDFALPVIVSRRQHNWGTGISITRHPGAMYGKHHQHHHYTHDHHSFEISSYHSTILFFFYLFFLFLVILRFLLTRLDGKKNFGVVCIFVLNSELHCNRICFSACWKRLQL